MKKYFLFAKNMWDQTAMYRLNFIVWRLRVVLGILMTYFLWLAILPKNVTLFGYSQQLMLTYIFGTSTLASLVLSSRSGEVGEEIKNGDLSNYLLRPINYFFLWFAKDIGDKAMNITFSIIELIILFVLLHPPIFLQTNILFIVLSFLAIGNGVLLFFLINFLIGLLAFWMYEIWPVRFLFMVLLGFFAGRIFPLDILPKPLFTFFQILPFSYLLYFPVKVYLGQLTFLETLAGLSISCIWLFFMYALVAYTWKKGLTIYTAHGR